MKLGIVNDFVPGERAGGANRAIVLYLKEAQLRYAPRQLEMIICTPGNVDKSCDAYLVFLIKTFSDEDLGFIQTRPFVECGFDWWPDEDGNAKWRNLFHDKAKLTVFVSPLHEQRLRQLYCIEPRASIVVPPPLEEISAVVGERNGLGIWASEWHAAKGPDLAAVLARRLNLHIDMYSPSMPTQVLRNKYAFTSFCHPKGFVPEDEWYATLARYSKLLHTPRIPDAFGYITLEAYMLGLSVILQGRTGVESYDLTFSDLLTLCFNSSAAFWEAVENAI